MSWKCKKCGCEYCNSGRKIQFALVKKQRKKEKI